MTAPDPALVAATLEFIRSRGDATWPNLMAFARHHGLGVDGDWQIEPIPNGIVWFGMSTAFLALVDALKPHIDLQPMSAAEALMVHGWDGSGIPNLPVAERAPREAERGYAKPKWIPTLIKAKQP